MPAKSISLTPALRSWLRAFRADPRPLFADDLVERKETVRCYSKTPRAGLLRRGLVEQPDPKDPALLRLTPLGAVFLDHLDRDDQFVRSAYRSAHKNAPELYPRTSWELSAYTVELWRERMLWGSLVRYPVPKHLRTLAPGAVLDQFLPVDLPDHPCPDCGRRTVLSKGPGNVVHDPNVETRECPGDECRYRFVVVVPEAE